MNLREQLIVDLERARHGFGAVGVGTVRAAVDGSVGVSDGSAGGSRRRSAGGATGGPFVLPVVRLTSPACGDEVTVEVTVTRQFSAVGGSGLRIRDLRWSGHGCTVSQASASALAAVISGAGRSGIGAGCAGIDSGQFAGLTTRFELLVRGAGTGEWVANLPARANFDQLDALDALSATTGLGPAVAFAGIGRLPLRASCALLAWRAVAQALGEIGGSDVGGNSVGGTSVGGTSLGAEDVGAEGVGAEGVAAE